MRGGRLQEVLNRFDLETFGILEKLIAEERWLQDFPPKGNKIRWPGSKIFQLKGIRHKFLCMLYSIFSHSYKHMEIFCYYLGQRP